MSTVVPSALRGVPDKPYGYHRQNNYLEISKKSQEEFLSFQFAVGLEPHPVY